MFPSSCNHGRKSWRNWYNLCKRKFRQSTLRNPNWPQFSLLTHTWWAPVHQWWTTCLHFLNAKYFSDQRKFYVQDARKTLLKTSNLEQRESRHQREKKSAKYSLTVIYSSRNPRRGEGGNSPITTLIKVQKVQRGQKAPHNGSAILPKNIQVTPFSLKDLINIILENRFTSRPEGIDGFPGRHPNLNSSNPSLLENIVREVSKCILHLSDRRK